MATIVLSRRRDLLVDPAQHPRGAAHLSAASGLVRAGRWLYVVADDEHHLGVIEADGDAVDATAPVRLLRIFEGDLPATKKRRKAAKPDLEALIALPASSRWAHGALLALGSGSRPQRQRGALFALDADGGVVLPARALDLAPLYAVLVARFEALNLEGGFVGDGSLCLLQRGNGAGAVNACIAYDSEPLLDWLAAAAGPAPVPRTITTHALGAIDGVPLGFTDGVALPGGAWMFSAVAEASEDTYADGACVGSVIGFIAADGVLGRMHRLEGGPKVEGLSAALEGGRLFVLAVTDSDDPAQPSQLLAGEARFDAELTGLAAP